MLDANVSSAADDGSAVPELVEGEVVADCVCWCGATVDGAFLVGHWAPNYLFVRFDTVTSLILNDAGSPWSCLAPLGHRNRIRVVDVETSCC